MIKQSINVKQITSSGISPNFSDNLPLSSVIGAYRFYKNDNVDIDSLNNPIIEDAIKEIEKQCKDYVLLMTDWSTLDYKTHKSKEDLIEIKNTKNSKIIKYDLQSTIAVSDITGQPIAPLVQNLKTSNKILSTYNDDIDKNITNIDELIQRLEWISKNIITTKKTVSIVDREGDAISYLRECQNTNQLFLQRINDNNYLYLANSDNKIKTNELANSLSKGKKVKEIKYKNQKVTLYVNEENVEIKRDARKVIINKEGIKKKILIKGEPVKARFVVTKLINEKNEIVANWKLLTNVFDKKITAETITNWYYYRWKIETYFKLLKTSGFQLESWQQRKPTALFKRLLIVSYACLLVWKIVNNNHKNLDKIKKFLMKLSGTVPSSKNKITASALLKGLWVFLSMIEVLSSYKLDDLFDMKDTLDEMMMIIK